MVKDSGILHYCFLHYYIKNSRTTIYLFPILEHEETHNKNNTVFVINFWRVTMKRFIKKSLFFILPVLCIFICMEFLLRHIPNDYKIKKEYLDKNAQNIEILCLGSSEVYYGINPIYFSKNGFNASHIAQTIESDLEILKKYQNKLKRMKYIIIPVSYITLYRNLHNNAETWRIKNYTLYYNIHTSTNIKDYSEVLSFDTVTNIQRLYSYYIKKKQEITTSELGFGANHPSTYQEDLIKGGEEYAKRYTRNNKKGFFLFDGNIELLKSIIQIAQNNKAVVIFFTPPMYYTCRDNLDYGQIERSINAISEIAKEYNNTIYINYMYDKTFIKSDYFDAAHLNEIGAEKQTKLLNNLIIYIEKYGLGRLKS